MTVGTVEVVAGGERVKADGAGGGGGGVGGDGRGHGGEIKLILQKWQEAKGAEVNLRRRSQ